MGMARGSTTSTSVYERFDAAGWIAKAALRCLSASFQNSDADLPAAATNTGSCTNQSMPPPTAVSPLILPAIHAHALLL